jgi:hypothetical protein
VARGTRVIGRGVARQRYLSIGLLLLEQGRISCLAEGDNQLYGPRSAEVPPENTQTPVAHLQKARLQRKRRRGTTSGVAFAIGR